MGEYAHWDSLAIFRTIWITNNDYFPGGSDGKESACNAEDTHLILGWEDTLEKGMATHSSILAWGIPWTEELVGYIVHGVAKSWTQLSK